MDLVRTKRGTRYMLNLRTDSWAAARSGKKFFTSGDPGREDMGLDYFLLVGMDELAPETVEDLLSDGNEDNRITMDELRSSLRRLFEAGYVEEVQ